MDQRIISFYFLIENPSAIEEGRAAAADLGKWTKLPCRKYKSLCHNVFHTVHVCAAGPYLQKNILMGALFIKTNKGWIISKMLYREKII